MSKLFRVVIFTATLLMLFIGFRSHADELKIDVTKIRAELDKLETEPQPHIGADKSEQSITDEDKTDCECKTKEIK